MPHGPSRPNTSDTLPADAAAQSQSFQQVGRYQIIGRIGRGGMATVYKAHDPGIDRPIAIKFLHGTLCEDQEYRDRFLREARAAGGLSHPNIVTVHDVGEIEGRPYMAMELLDGMPLSDVMARGEPQPIKDVIEIGIQLAQALDYAHSRGVVHRDIKPGNIVRLKDSNTIKVTDFGIAHVNSAAVNHTRAGDVIGTPQYMSPEQATGKPIDGRSDLFAVGIVLYQLLCGERPFEAESVIALALKITGAEPVPIERRRPGLPPALRRVVERCLAKSADKRYQTGRELADALSRVLWELLEEQRQKSGPRIVPLRIKWAALMALIVAVVMAATAAFITNRQYNALMAQVTDYGASLARFIAAQNSAAVLGDEWVAVDVSVQEIMKTRDYQSITVLDHLGVVRVSSESSLIGHQYLAPHGQPLARREGGVQVQRYELNGEGVLGFEAPVMFQGRTLGRVALGIPERPLARVARYTLSLMVTLVFITVFAVALAMYILATWFGKPIRLLGESMEEIAKGRYDHRIREERRDEFGLLYRAFDRMAFALQERHQPRFGAAVDLSSSQISRSGGSGRIVMSASSIVKAPSNRIISSGHTLPPTNTRAIPPDSGILRAAQSDIRRTGTTGTSASPITGTGPRTGTSMRPGSTGTSVRPGSVGTSAGPRPELPTARRPAAPAADRHPTRSSERPSLKPAPVGAGTGTASRPAPLHLREPVPIEAGPHPVSHTGTQRRPAAGKPDPAR